MKKTVTKAKEMTKEKKENVMRKIVVDKVVLSIGVGKNMELLENAYVLAERLTGHKPVRTTATRKARTFKVQRGKPIGVKVTMRGKDKIEFLKRAMTGVDNKIKKSAFDNEGNFGFGIKEYLEVPGEKYDPKIGMLGFNVNVSLRRAGFRIKRRRIQKKIIPKHHRITKEDAIEFAQTELGVKIVSKL